MLNLINVYKHGHAYIDNLLEISIVDTEAFLHPLDINYIIKLQ